MTRTRSGISIQPSSAGIEHATSHSRSFFRWYNSEHLHGDIYRLTLHDVHCDDYDLGGHRRH